MITALFTGLGLLLTEVLDTTDGADGDLGGWFVDRRTDGLDPVAIVGSFLGSTFWVVGVVVVLDVVFLAIGRRWWAVALTATLVLEASVFGAVQLVVDRPRPEVEQLEEAAPTASYPSGHTGAATALYLTLAGLATIPTGPPPRRRTESRRRSSDQRSPWSDGETPRTSLRVIAFAIALGLGVYVGISRLYQGVHFPTDVAAGLLLGSASCWLGRFVVSRTARRADEASSGPLDEPLEPPFERRGPVGPQAGADAEHVGLRHDAHPNGALPLPSHRPAPSEVTR